MFKHISYKSFLAVFFVTSTLVLLSSCWTQTAIPTTRNESAIYNPTKNYFIPEFTVFDNTEEESVLSVKIRRDQLFFSEANATGEPMASVNIGVWLYNKNLNGIICDSAVYDFDVKKNGSAPEFVCRVALKAYSGVSYYAIVKIYDKLKHKSSTSYIDFKKDNEFGSNNFKVYSHFGNREIFIRELHADEYVNIRYPRKTLDTLYLFYYKPVTAISPAPSVLLPEVTTTDKPEKIFPLAYSDTLPLMFPRPGIYLFSVDSTKYQGITLFNFGPDYPGMTSAETMIPPLEYIATTEEMDSLRNAEKPKVALDDFWMRHAGNIEKAKELIRIYYFRVQYANIYFTSYKSGWLTDRGMIYMVYGPPDRLQKTIDTEKWGYKLPPVQSRWREKHTFESQYLWFTFTRKDNKFTDNDYSLNRALTPISYWDQAVASWRRGKVFRLDNPKEYQ
jgi:GWxTD domain-containing protein